MFGRDIDKFFEEMMYRNSPQRSHFYDTIGGRYIEVIDGEKIEYEYEDGIWKKAEDESSTSPRLPASKKSVTICLFFSILI